MRASCRSIVASSDAATALRISRATRAGPPFESRYACQRVTSARACQPGLWRRRKSRRARVEWALATVQSPCRRATSARASSVSARSWFARSRLQQLGGTGERLVGLLEQPGLHEHPGPVEEPDAARDVGVEGVSERERAQRGRDVAGEELRIPEVVLGLELLPRHPELGGQPRARRQVRTGGPQVSAQEVDGPAVEQHGGAVVGVEVGEEGDRCVGLGQRHVEPAAAQRDETVELVDQRSQVATVAGGRRLRGRSRRRLAALEAVDLELRERPRDEQPGPRVQPLRTGPGVLPEQGEAALHQARPPRRMPGGVRRLRVQAELLDPGQQVVTWWRGPSCRRELLGRALVPLG